ncbi:MarR family transcriptional regulator [Streptomyces sp. NPDC006655]|uniref:MarR family transcriptional regulator n=1 Tax=Streptomyces sp. NPDC006655 TaxID=3156898 RepID=UPI0034560919
MTEPHDDDDRTPDTENISRLWERVVPMFSLLQGRMDRTLSHRHGVGVGPLMALGVLVREHPESVTVGGVARRLGLSVSAASRMLAHLERAGWTGPGGLALRPAHQPGRGHGLRVTAVEPGQ